MTATQRTETVVQQIAESLNLIGTVRSSEEMQKRVGRIFSRVYPMILSVSKFLQGFNQLEKQRLQLQMQWLGWCLLKLSWVLRWVLTYGWWWIWFRLQEQQLGSLRIWTFRSRTFCWQTLGTFHWSFQQVWISHLVGLSPYRILSNFLLCQLIRIFKDLGLTISCLLMCSFKDLCSCFWPLLDFFSDCSCLK